MVLIVDDKEENLYSLRTLLEINLFNVDTANSGEEALKKVLKHTYALIILDVQMPGMDGFEVAEAISGYGKARDTPIIFLSAVNTDKRFITKGYMSGGFDYVTKPFDPDILLLKVKTFYRLYEQTRELNEMQQVLREEIESRKQAENELKERVAELHSVLHSIPQLAFTALTDGSVEIVNGHWLQYARDNNAFPQTEAGALSVSGHLLTAISRREQYTAELAIQHIATGEYRWHLLAITPVRHNNEIIKWVGTFTDIHQQKMINEMLERGVAERTLALQKMNTELETSNHDLQQFTSVACHDLQEPLRKIQIFSHMVRDKYLADQSEGAMYLDRVMNASTRMRLLINDLLSYSEISITRLFAPVDLNDVIADILTDLELVITEKQASIHIDDIPLVEAVPGQMRHVFQNIISNALKFSRKEVTPEIRIKAALVNDKDAAAEPDAAGSYCRISISDNGIGFNERYLSKIFTIFQRLHSKEEYEGTGIGLAIAKKVIDKHNGFITATSKEQEGSTFIIVLPVKQQAAEQVPV
ncbi:sensor histidine kinase [Deminuibacter soli]|uniref:histidine kinase n=1 Tax=Deminuibacter soli TaxID=2291815 RepID=A0A3E1NIJ3_9BACT|nr:response regulator [Deminuibacter soli]RFM27749.1 response regulator [Deminuibacter soli]